VHWLSANWLLVVIVAVMAVGFALWRPCWRDAKERISLGAGLMTGAGISLAFFFLQDQNQQNRQEIADRQALRVRVGVEQNLSGTDLRHSELRGVDLGNKDLSEADLRGADLREASLRGAHLQNATLEGADLRDADLTEAKLNKAFLNGADLRGATLEDAILEDAAIGIGANLSGAWLVDAHLAGTCLASADLSDAVLGGADLRDAILTGADLRGAILERDGVPANLAGAWVARVKVDPANRQFLPLDTATPAPAKPSRSPAVPGDAIADRITLVSDGDTVKLERRGWVRLFGLGARDLDDPLGAEARDFLADAMGRAGAIRFKLGRTPRETRTTGIPGRWLVYIWLSDGRFLNEAMLAEGYAERQKDARRPEDPRFARLLDQAEQRAKAGGKRIWATCPKQERR
jgi:uncharacterized protein YjbI with pentapeptide repeats